MVFRAGNTCSDLEIWITVTPNPARSSSLQTLIILKFGNRPRAYIKPLWCFFFLVNVQKKYQTAIITLYQLSSDHMQGNTLNLSPVHPRYQPTNNHWLTPTFTHSTVWVSAQHLHISGLWEETHSNMCSKGCHSMLNKKRSSCCNTCRYNPIVCLREWLHFSQDFIPPLRTLIICNLN